MNFKKIYTYVFFLGILNCLTAQDVQYSRRVSQNEVISRTIGSIKITIDYHSPLAKRRTIFDGVVSYDFTIDGKEYAWRAGSNQRTTVEFTHDVVINGSHLKAGNTMSSGKIL